MRYVISKARFEQEEMAYRIFVTDTFKSVYGMNKRYYDMFSDDYSLAKKEYNADEVVANIKTKIKFLEKEGSD